MKIKQLFEQANALEYSHSNGMHPVSEMKGPGFFPGCIGTVRNDISLKALSVMVVGQDFDTAENHKNIKDIEKGEVEKNTTWRNLKQLLKEININPEQCFFTNAILHSG